MNLFQYKSLRKIIVKLSALLSLTSLKMVVTWQEVLSTLTYKLNVLKPSLWGAILHGQYFSGGLNLFFSRAILCEWYEAVYNYWDCEDKQEFQCSGWGKVKWDLHLKPACLYCPTWTSSSSSSMHAIPSLAGRATFSSVSVCRIWDLSKAVTPWNKLWWVFSVWISALPWQRMESH